MMGATLLFSWLANLNLLLGSLIVAWTHAIVHSMGFIFTLLMMELINLSILSLLPNHSGSYSSGSLLAVMITFFVCEAVLGMGVLIFFSRRKKVDLESADIQ